MHGNGFLKCHSIHFSHLFDLAENETNSDNFPSTSAGKILSVGPHWNSSWCWEAPPPGSSGNWTDRKSQIRTGDNCGGESYSGKGGHYFSRTS